MKNPIFDQTEIDTALELLDVVDVGMEGRIEGPYSVFSANPNTDTPTFFKKICMRNGFTPPAPANSPSVGLEKEKERTRDETDQREHSLCIQFLKAKKTRTLMET